MSVARACSTGRVLLLTVLILAAGCDEKRPKVVDTPPPVVQVSLPIERTVTDYQVFTARTQAVQSVDIKARVTGFLTGIHFKDGGEVKEGQVLFDIDDRPYKAALDHAKAAVEVARAALVKAEAEYMIGLNVQKDNPGAISDQDIVKRLGSRDEAKGNIDKSKATLDNAQLNYGWCKVTAPISGRANTHFLDIGNLVSQDVTILTNIVSLRPTWAYFYVDENTMLKFQKLAMAGKIQSARKEELPVQMGLADSTGYPFEGVIDFISNQLDPNLGSLRVRAVFPNKDGVLGAGLFGRVRVPVGAPHKALLVVDSAVGTNQGQRYVYVVNDKDEVEYRGVNVLQLHGSLREVERYREVTETGPDGTGVPEKVEILKPTDRVIVDGLQRVRPGVKVEPQLVDMTTFLVQPQAAPTKKESPKAK
jgi:RND family efflux transporter MFP subunit